MSYATLVTVARILLVVVALLFLSLAADADNASPQWLVQVDKARQQCEATHFRNGRPSPHGNVAFWKCMNKAEAPYLTHDADPDIWRLIFSTRLAIAVERDAGRITREEAQRRYDQILVEARSEAMRRHSAPPPVFIPSPPLPRTCFGNVIGNSIFTNCF